MVEDRLVRGIGKKNRREGSLLSKQTLDLDSPDQKQAYPRNPDTDSSDHLIETGGPRNNCMPQESMRISEESIIRGIQVRRVTGQLGDR